MGGQSCTSAVQGVAMIVESHCHINSENQRTVPKRRALLPPRDSSEFDYVTVRVLEVEKRMAGGVLAARDHFSAGALAFLRRAIEVFFTRDPRSEMRRASAGDRIRRGGGA